MPVTPTYPGVYIEEVPSGVRTITPVATSIAAFVGSAPRGLANQPVRVQSFAAYQRKFGDLHPSSLMSYAVSQYFQNGGSDALIVRVVHLADALTASVNVGGLALLAASPGVWGNAVRVRIDLDTKDKGTANPSLFNIFTHDASTKMTEVIRNVSTDPEDQRFVKTVLEDESELVRVDPAQPPSGRPGASGAPQPKTQWHDDPGAYTQAQGGADGTQIVDADILGNEGLKQGIYALDKAELFNTLCLPPASTSAPDVEEQTYSAALAFCKRRRAILLIDAPSSWTIDTAEGLLANLLKSLGSEELTRNAALFFPRIKVPDPLKQNRLREFVPCGAIAGVFARTDVSRGVWKAPAGIAAGLSGVQGFSQDNMTDLENGRLNPLGVNCLRNFRAFGNVIWGSRTLAGSDALASEWKYLPVRRFTLFLEESLYRGTQWVVFEPNDEPLWRQIRLNIGAFLHGLFRQGAFQGGSPREAYFVKCDHDTTTQNDINRGIVNIEVGFAPLKPAEFVIIKVQQMAGKIET